MNGDRGLIFDVQRWSLNDGHGVRTLVFFKGCPLRCFWCCNPESQSTSSELALFPDKCTDCGGCVEKCPEGVALSALSGGFTHRSDCTGCGLCVEGCPWGAREIMGTWYSVEDILNRIKRDMVFYRKTGGGVTFSGGEATAQPEFLRRLAGKCSSLGIHTALETCGFFNWDSVEDVVSKMDLLFLDIKHMDSKAHRRYTGRPNETILENAVRIGHAGVPMVVRIPVIPGINDSEDNVRATAEFVIGNLPSCLGIELLPYHRLGVEKYGSLGRRYPMGNKIEPPSEGLMESLAHTVRTSGVSVVSFQ